MQADQYSLTEVADLGEAEETRINNFGFTTNDGSVQVELGARAAQITADDPTLATQGMIIAVKGLCKRRRRWVCVDRLFWLVALIGAVLTTLCVVLIPNDNNPDTAPWQSLASIGLTIVGFVGAVLFRSGIPMVVLSTRTRDHAPTWLSRNKDGLTTNLIVSFIFLVVGFVVGKIT
jgi:uncharacterized membrane protein